MNPLEGFDLLVRPAAEKSWPRSYGVHAVKRSMIVASAEATDMGPEGWIVNRVVVLEHRGAPRGKGIGSYLLRKLLADVAAAGAKRVRVEPGGYGADPAAQVRFYRRMGFEPTRQPGVLEWKP